MKKAKALTFAIMFAIPLFAFALPTSFPNPTGFVTDTAGMLSAPTKQALEIDLQNFAKSSGYEVAVLTVPTLEGTTIEDYATRVFEKWKIGDKKLDTGVLFLVARDDKQMRIEVGYGAEPVLTDINSYEILTQTIRPLFKVGNYEEGIKQGVSAIEQVLSKEPVVAATNTEQPVFLKIVKGLFNQFGFLIFAVILLFIQFVFTSVLTFFAKSKSWWQGGLAGAIISSVVVFVFFSAVVLVFKLFIILFFALLGFFIDFIVSKYGYKKFENKNIWFLGGGFGGRGGGGFGGSGFGGFGGGSSGGGGSSSSW